MLHTLLLVGLAGIVLLLRVLWDHWAYDKFYVDGRSPTELADAHRWRARSIPFILVGIGSSWAAQEWPGVPLLQWTALIALATGISLLFRAAQRVPTYRTVLSVGLIIASVVLFILAARAGWVPRSLASEPVQSGRLAAVAVAAGILLFVAARLSRPS
jgi:hypothetical protein